MILENKFLRRQHFFYSKNMKKHPSWHVWLIIEAFHIIFITILKSVTFDITFIERKKIFHRILWNAQFAWIDSANTQDRTNEKFSTCSKNHKILESHVRWHSECKEFTVFQYAARIFIHVDTHTHIPTYLYRKVSLSAQVHVYIQHWRLYHILLMRS